MRDDRTQERRRGVDLQGQRRTLARLDHGRHEGQRQARPSAPHRQDARRGRDEDPRRSRWRARRARSPRSTLDTVEAWFDALADAHRGPPRPGADAGELRVDDPHARRPAHRRAADGPAAARAPRASLQPAARAGPVPHHRAAGAPDHLPRPQGRDAAPAHPPQRRHPGRPAGAADERGRHRAHARGGHGRPARRAGPNATPPGGPSRSRWACGSPRRSRCSGRTSTCSTAR